MRLALSLVLLFAPMQAWAAPNPEAIFRISADEERRIQKGDIIVHVEETDEPIKRTLVTGLIDAPPDVVYPIYADFESYPELFKTAKSSDILKREGNVLTCKVVMDFPWPLGSRWVTNHTTMDPENTSFTFKKFDGSVRIYEGSLKILPEGNGRSRVVYAAKVDPALPVPAWLVNMISANYFPMAIERVREKLAKSGKGTTKAK
jgi:ribosome-associated toxin RatA of RatAB toxin-antitoxin module